jgi:hypothetical protein
LTIDPLAASFGQTGDERPVDLQGLDRQAP